MEEGILYKTFISLFTENTQLLSLSGEEGMNCLYYPVVLFFSPFFSISPVSKDDRRWLSVHSTARVVAEVGLLDELVPRAGQGTLILRARQEARAQQRSSEQLMNAKPSGTHRPPRNAFPMLILPHLWLSGASAGEL